MDWCYQRCTGCLVQGPGTEASGGFGQEELERVLPAAWRDNVIHCA